MQAKNKQTPNEANNKTKQTTIESKQINEKRDIMLAGLIGFFFFFEQRTDRFGWCP